MPLSEQALSAAVGMPLADLALIKRVHEAIRDDKDFLAYKRHGERIAASRTRTMIERWGRERSHKKDSKEPQEVERPRSASEIQVVDLCS